MEILDIYDAQRNRTGRFHRRGSRLSKGEYILITCVWVCDRAGRLLLTLRAPEKNGCPNTWENSGGAAKAGETSRQSIARELYEETGLRAAESDFLLLESERTRDTFFDFYFLRHTAPLEQIVLQPGETADARWVTLEEMEQMIDAGIVAPPIARRFHLHKPRLQKLLQDTKE